MTTMYFLVFFVSTDCYTNIEIHFEATQLGMADLHTANRSRVLQSALGVQLGMATAMAARDTSKN